MRAAPWTLALTVLMAPHPAQAQAPVPMAFEVTLNGENLGRMSRQSNPETWLFAPPDPPVKTSRR